MNVSDEAWKRRIKQGLFDYCILFVILAIIVITGK